MLSAVSTSDPNLSAIGPVLLSAMQKVANDVNSVSSSALIDFTVITLVLTVHHL